MNNIKNIKVLGSGCPNCEKLFESTKEALKVLEINIKVEYVTDINKIMALGVITTPVLMINDKLAISGRVPGVDEIKDVINKY